MLKKYLIPTLVLSFTLITFFIYKVAMTSNALTAKFDYFVKIGYPYEYTSIYERDNSYLMDAKGEPLIYFGGAMSAGNDWGAASQITSPEMNLLPAGIKVRWFSVAENQFWEGEYRFDREQVAKLYETEIWDIFYQKKRNYDFSSFNVYVVPGGLVTVWVGGAGQVKFLAQFQAKKTDMNWDEFDRNTIRAPVRYATREGFVSEINAESYTPESTREQVKAGTLPVDSAPWKQRMLPYSWALTVSEPFKVKDYLGWYINGERYYTYADTSAQNIFRPMPYFLSVYIEKPDKTLEHFDIELKEAEVMAAFKKLSGSLGVGKTEVYFELSEDRQTGAVYLKNKQERIKLTAEISLQDLYNKP